ncbi:hypothetical protein B0T22DRAFT_465753 [Podospora appendiculata]|uniref:rRNA methyltransferase 1, mitochondrial n=1 Tax=Podospora appendiculata TaxID=314037 RepID=A0AAE1CAF5_9PEZI|nr:hypothetical protein B0T22DRAFT_465753 [Podospora appendiculata]
MTLSMLCRAAARPTVTASRCASSVFTLTCPTRRPASLSSIHKGLRRSEKAARSQNRSAGSRQLKALPTSAEGSPVATKPMTYAERKAAREAVEKAKPDFKIRKGKKDITEYPAKANPQSRQARFFDPESKFGKRSLVYQLKTGQLKEEFKAISSELPSRSSRDAPSRGSRSFSSPRRSSDRPGRESARSSRGRGGFGAPGRSGDSRPSRASRVVRPSSRTLDLSGRSPEGLGDSRPSGNREANTPPRRAVDSTPREAKSREESRPSKDRDSFSERFSEHFTAAPRRSAESAGPWADTAFRSSYDSSPRPRPTSRIGSAVRELRPRGNPDNQPLSIPYTTAASQFLYGKSVVEAALQSSRRKLYKLYIYGGANRQNMAQDVAVENLARRKKVETIVLGEEGLRLMDKMSQSRPHNGYVLEASPLPQPPVTGLGPMSEEGGRSGYHANLGHQSAEEAAVNGTSRFITSVSKTHKPLVVVLDQVLDPGNLGAILRTVSFLGATAVAITKKNSASLTPVALKASAGASEALTMFSVENLPSFLTECRENDWQIYAAAPTTAKSNKQRHLDMHEVEDLDPLSKKPCILLIGSEGEGLSKVVKSKADFEVNIPNLSGMSAIDSLNVSVATGLLCSAFLKGQVKSQFSMIHDEEQKAALW